MNWWQADMQNRYPPLGVWYQRVQRKPSWVWKITVATAAVVFVLPLVLLTLAALLVAGAVFTVLSLIAAGLATVHRAFGGGPQPPRADDNAGRRNVRVVHRYEP